MSEFAIEMLEITKKFGNLIANDNITLKVRRGTIHGLIGENGAGKSTLMNILYGIYQPDSGQIKINGKSITIKNPLEAQKLSIGMVHQHFMLIKPYTIYENIILNCEPKSRIFLNKKKAISNINEISKKFGLNIDPLMKIEDAPVGIQQRVEILKVLYRGAEILILDEPTAVLTPQEIKELFKILLVLKKNGKTIIFISHKLKEIKEITDEITVIRKGKLTGTKKTAQISQNEIASLMVGREIDFSKSISKKHVENNNIILKLENIEYIKENKKILDNINLEVYSGEIVGIAGVEGNGQSEIANIITGIIKNFNGKIYLNNKNISHFTIKERVQSGISYIPEDRLKTGVLKGMSLNENFLLGQHWKNEFGNLFLNYKKIKSILKKELKNFDVYPADPDYKINELSGGNQQKFVIAREIYKKPKFILAMQPTRGVDIGACEFIYKSLVKERENGAGILLISSELSELILLSDRLLVIYNGKIVGELKPYEYNEEKIGLLMLGYSQKENKI